MTELSSRVADRYRIDARIGGGGMADVFEARDEALQRDVAIKLLRGIDDVAAARRFAEEIRLTARLNHPNVVRLFDAGEHDGSPYLVLERVTGGTLAQAMTQEGMAPQRVADIGRQTAAALEHAHAEGVVHRDVKPSNILLTAEGTVRLADFGIALTATATRLTVAGSVAGSAGYVSPEQVLGTGAGAGSDVYALGLVLLECLTGKPPWSGTTVEVALARITADPPIPHTVPESWRGLLRAMTARQPEDRPAMGVVAAALEELAAGRLPLQFPIPARPAAPRRWRMPAVVAVTMLLLGAGALLLLDRPAPSAATSPTAAAPFDSDGVIAASAVRGAAVEEAPSPSAAGETTTRRQGSAPVRQPADDSTDTAATAASGRAPAAGNGDSAGGTIPRLPAPAAKPDVQREVAEPSRPTRDTSLPPAPPAEEDRATEPDDGGSDDSSDGDVSDTHPANNGRGKGATKARGPDVSGPDLNDAANGVGVGAAQR